MTLGRNIRRIRRAKDITQVEACKRSGISRAGWVNIERGKAQPLVSTLERMAKALDCSVKDFFEEKPII